jgi:hypothetical protein
MGPVILILGIAIGLSTFLFMILARYATRSIAGVVELRMRAAECIVNDERIPPDWLAAYKARRDGFIAKGAGPEELEKLGLKAQKDCLKKINDLLRYYEDDRTVDSTESRMVLLNALQKQKKIWEDAGWEYFLK